MRGEQEPEIKKCPKLQTIILILSFKVKDVFRNIKIGFTNENRCGSSLSPQYTRVFSV